jgi:hypothetical protein
MCYWPIKYGPKRELLQKNLPASKLRMKPKAWVVDFYEVYASSEAGPERLNWLLGFEKTRSVRGDLIASVTLTDQRWGPTAPLNKMLAFVLPTLGAYSPASIMYANCEAVQS